MTTKYPLHIRIGILIGGSALGWSAIIGCGRLVWWLCR